MPNSFKYNKKNKKAKQTKFWIKSSLDKHIRKFSGAGMFFPFITALLVMIVMASVCFLGVTSAMESKDKKNFKPELIRQNKPRILPSIGSSRQDKSPMEKNMPAMLAIQQALADLQESKYTDTITPFAEQLRLTDFALMQASINQNIEAKHVRLIQRKKRQGPKGDYYLQYIAILAPKDFAQNLSQSLKLWKSDAILEGLEKENFYAISSEGIRTHIIELYQNEASFKLSIKRQVSPELQGKTKLFTDLEQSSESPRLVIVMDDLGASKRAIDRLLDLSYPVTFAFWPYADYTDTGARRAHAQHKEILVHMPMEPMGYPEVNSGQGSLMLRMGNEEIEQRVLWGIAQVPYATGLNNHMGSKFTQSKEKTGVVLSILKSKNLFVLDSLTHQNSVFYSEAERYNIPRLQRSVFLDVEARKSAVLKALKRAERIASMTGTAIAIGHPLPDTLEALEEWQKIRDKKVLIVRLEDLL